MTDTDALTERIARALHEIDPITGHGHDWRKLTNAERRFYRHKAAAVLPIVAEEVRAAKAEALREYADALEAVPDYAPTEYDKGRVDQRHATIEELHVRATEYETGDSDEHR